MGVKRWRRKHKTDLYGLSCWRKKEEEEEEEKKKKKKKEEEEEEKHMVYIAPTHNNKFSMQRYTW